MFTDLFLSPKIYDKIQRRDKIKELCLSNVVFKRNFNGFNYTILNKKLLFDKNNIKTFNNYIENIKIPVYEVLGYNTPTKIYLDCEMEELPQNVGDKEKIILEFNNNLINFLNNIYHNNNIQILYSDASRITSSEKYKISLHVVINNLGYFIDRKKLKVLISNFSNQLPKNIFQKNGKSFVDHEVYHTSQLIRLIFSPNKQANSILKPFIIENNNIIYKNIDYISDNYSMSLCGNYDNNMECLDDTIILEKNNKNNKNNNKLEITEQLLEIPEWKINWVKNNTYIKDIYEVDNIYKNKINLKRIKSNEYCKLCKRNHDKDNCFCIVFKNNIMFYCNRNNKGVSIGSWYDNYNNTKNESIEEKELLKLRHENIKLKEIIKDLEERIKDLKTIKKYIPHKNTTQKNYNKSNNLLDKYYEGGKLLINNNLEEFKKIIVQNWKDKNLSKLKNRCLRIYKLLEFMKENNIQYLKSSMRNIFHIPGWKFDESLKNKTFFT